MRFSLWARTRLGELTLALVALMCLVWVALAITGSGLARDALFFLLGSTLGLALVSLIYHFSYRSRTVLGLLFALFILSFVLLALVPEMLLLSVQGYLIFVGGSFLREFLGRTAIGEGPSDKQ